MIAAKVIADSKNEFGDRITTMVVTFPRFILAELNTHRMFSRNSASSRAIPFEKMVKSVKENPFIPIAWQKDHKGMQGSDYHGKDNSNVAEGVWKMAIEDAIDNAENLYANGNGITKQLCNRLLEPFMWHTVIVTATEWENFFALRCPQYVIPGSPGVESIPYRSKKEVIKYLQFGAEENYWHNFTEIDWLKLNKGQAEIHMMALAEAMWDAMNESTPRELKAGEWHIPFGDNTNNQHLNNLLINDIIDSKNNNELDCKIKIATARCARVSYTVVGEEGKSDNYANDIKLHDNLAKSGHWSPFEHCAKAMDGEEYNSSICGKFDINYADMVTDDYKTIDGGASLNSFGWSGNFRGFVQYRKMFQNENITK